MRGNHKERAGKLWTVGGNWSVYWAWISYRLAGSNHKERTGKLWTVGGNWSVCWAWISYRLAGSLCYICTLLQCRKGREVKKDQLDAMYKLRTKALHSETLVCVVGTLKRNVIRVYQSNRHISSIFFAGRQNVPMNEESEEWCLLGCYAVWLL
jgi:hypothetical protein